MKHMAEELGLTDAQKEQVKSILQAQKPKLDALRENESLNRRQKMKQGRELRESVQKQIRAPAHEGKRCDFNDTSLH